MNTIILLVLTLGCLVILIKWRIRVAQDKLEGNPVPEEICTRQSDGLILYFYHPMCGPCHSMMPVIREIGEKYPDRVKIINIGDYRDSALAMGIRATPTSVLVKDSKIIKAIIGASSIKTLETMLKPNDARI